MGQCCSKAQYELIRRFDEDAWHNWDGHFARQFYDIDHTLGKGAFSEVVAATQRDTGRRVALKVVFLDNPRLTEDHASVLRDEVAIIESLRHPNVVTFDCVMEDPVRRQIVIAEEILLGGTLTEELGAAAANNDDRLLAHVFRQLLSALAHMHRAGIVHRDLKPENVMFRAEAGQWAQTGAVPVIIDFGMSTRVQPGSPPVVGLLGSPGFVAPEVIRGEPHTPALDMFAVGVMLYICIAGGRPMTPKQANTLAYARCEAWEHANMPGDELWQSANARVRAFVLQLLERDPEKRITAAAALKHPWVTADMLVPRPLSVRANPAGVAAERRSRLSAERRQSTVEEMLRYMILALRERQQSHDGGKHAAGSMREPLLQRRPSAAAYLAPTSVSAPQADTATSFFQWMQQHLDDLAGDEGPPATAPPDAAAAAAAERPQLRDVRCNSDMTHAAAASSRDAATAAAAAVAARVLGGEASAPPPATSGPADLLVQSHLQRHLSLVRRSSSSSVHRATTPSATRTNGNAAHALSPGSAAATAASPSPEEPSVQARERSAFDVGPMDGGEAAGSAAKRNGVAHGRWDAVEVCSPDSGDTPAVEQGAAGAGQPRVQFADVVRDAYDPSEPQHGAGGAGAEPRPTSVVDSFPLYHQGKGARLYSVVLAATRRAKRDEQGGPVAADADRRQAGAIGQHGSVSLEEISAVAQVEWGLRRWRQLAKRVPTGVPSEGGRSGGAVADALPEDVKQAKSIAELALRFRGVNM